MKLDYATLYSNKPLAIYGLGSIKSPTYGEVIDITTSSYNEFIYVLMLDPDSYIDLIEKEHYLENYQQEDKDRVKQFKRMYNKMNQEDKSKITMYDVMLVDRNILIDYVQALNFFFVEDVEFTYSGEKFNIFIENCLRDYEENKIEYPEEFGIISKVKKIFRKLFKKEVGKENVDMINTENKIIVGEINRSNFNEIVDIILQRNGVKTKKEEEEIPKFKNEATRKLWMKMQEDKKKLEKIKAKKVDKDMEFGNIISSIVAFNHSGITPMNINDLTIFQIYDIFNRLRINESYRITSRSVSIWGDEKGSFKDNLWYQHMDN